MTILVVEDDQDVLGFISALLRAAGHTVIEAADGESAISQFENCECSIVLLDWVLPGMSGIEVAERINEAAYCYIIMMTALSERQHGGEALHAGAKDYIEKPFENEELMEAVDLGVAAVDVREKLFKRLEKRGVDVSMIKEFA